MAILKLTKPFMYNGEQLTEISYDLESVTPAQYSGIIKRLQKKGQGNIPELDLNVQMAFFAASTEIQIPVSQLNGLCIKDFVKIGQLVRDFFLSGSDDVTETEEESPEDISE